MKIKTLILFFSAVAFLGVSSIAQNINTISYVPVKQGSYDKITTKSVTALATDIGNVSAKTVKVNSSKLTLETRKITFGKPVVVKGSVFSRQTAVFAVKSKITVAGVAQASGNVAANASQGATSLQATNLNMPTRKLDVGSGTIYVDGIAIPSPNCNLEWRSVSAKNAFNQDVTYNLLACQGGGGGGGGCTCSGGISPGGTQPCGGNSNCVKTCQSNCTWSACVGTPPYQWNGSACVNSGGGNLNISTRTVNVLASYKFTVINTNYAACYAKEITGSCSQVDSISYFDGGSLGYVPSSMNGPSMCQMGAEGTEGYNSGWDGGTPVVAGQCPSGTNQSICASNCSGQGCSYSCVLSASYPSFSSPYFERRCEPPCEKDRDIGCNDLSGTATILTCTRS